jgi:hypothetical protein
MYLQFTIDFLSETMCRNHSEYSASCVKVIRELFQNRGCTIIVVSILADIMLNKVKLTRTQFLSEE